MTTLDMTRMEIVLGYERLERYHDRRSRVSVQHRELAGGLIEERVYVGTRLVETRRVTPADSVGLPHFQSRVEVGTKIA